MKRSFGAREGIRSAWGGWARSWMGVLAAVLAGVAAVGLPARAQAPTVTSVVPANGATGVATDAALVFTFSQAMDDSLALFPSVPPFLVGNMEFTPADVFSEYDCSWSADSRTLTCEVTGALPENTKITWKMNPAGTQFPFKSAGGTAVATTTGSFTTGTGGGDPGGGDPGGGDPGGGGTGAKLVSTSPATGATAVPVSASVVFVFDQEMQPNPQLGGIPPLVKGAVAWTGTGLDATKFSYAWSADGKTLTCEYSGGLPGTTQVGWTINPAGGLLQIVSADDQTPAESASGSFTTGAGSGTGGGGDENCTDGEELPADWGGYNLAKSAQFVQDSAADPVLWTDSAPSFGVFLTAPAAGPAIAAGSVTIPGGTRKDLQPLPFGGALFFSEEFGSVAALDAAYPGGGYTLRFQPTGQTERVVAMTMPVSGPPTPKVANYDEAQNVNPAQNFTLKWGAFTGAVAGTDHLSLIVRDAAKIVFSAPNPCIPRELAVTATQVVIPAGILSTAKVYDAELTFSRVFFSSSNAVPKMFGSGSIGRATQFKITTQGGTPPAAAARFISYRLLPDGKPELTLTGTAGRTYSILRSTAPAGQNWNPAGAVVIGGNGQAVYTDPAPGAFPAYYRALSL